MRVRTELSDFLCTKPTKYTSLLMSDSYSNSQFRNTLEREPPFGKRWFSFQCITLGPSYGIAHCLLKPPTKVRRANHQPRMMDACSSLSSKLLIKENDITTVNDITNVALGITLEFCNNRQRKCNTGSNNYVQTFQKIIGEFGAPQQISTGFASWQRYCTAL